MARILLAEDEKPLADAETLVLRHFGYEVDAVYDGEAALEKALGGVYDCMVFDIMMPKMDGIEALRKIRAAGNVTPVILLTAKTEVDDRIAGLDAGADDYLSKPFAMGELLARIRANTRRADAYTPRVLSVGGMALDTDEQELRGESAIRLSSRETKLLKFLMLHERTVFSTEDLFRKVWDDEPEVGQDIVWMYISFLREKIEAVHGSAVICGDKGGCFSLQKK